jgi:hypothetical protein
MPRIIVQANQSGGDTGRVTLSERVLASHLHDGHYAAQLIERLTWAAIDAERLESPTDDADGHHGPRPIQPSRDTVSSRPGAGMLQGRA